MCVMSSAPLLHSRVALRKGYAGMWLRGEWGRGEPWVRNVLSVILSVSCRHF